MILQFKKLINYKLTYLDSIAKIIKILKKKKEKKNCT